MQVKVTNVTDDVLTKVAFDSTVAGVDTKIKWLDALLCEHSPIRTQMYLIEMEGIPSFVSTHYVRHKIGVEHFVQTNRDDRGAKEVADRNTPVNHTMLCNAEALINMAKKRLCYKSHKKTRDVMQLIIDELTTTDYDLSICLVPMCVYRNGLCPERKWSCGALSKNMVAYGYYREMFPEYLEVRPENN